MTLLTLGALSDERRHEVTDAAGGRTVRVLASLTDIDAVDTSVDAVVNVAGSVDRVLELLPNLRWVHSGVAGVDAVLTERLRDSDVVLTSATGNGAIPLAEHALLLMLMLNRQAPRWLAAQTQHRWERFTHDELYGETLGIIGLGHSGTHLAGAATALGMNVVALTRRPPVAPPDGIIRVYPPHQLHDFLRRCDVVVVTAPYTAETHHLIDAAALRCMRPHGHLICISRGGIVDDRALLEALDEGRVGAAGLDAHTTEPLPDDSPYWDHPKVIITPHNGATTPGTAARGWRILLDNVHRFATEQPLINVVDKNLGY